MKTWKYSQKGFSAVEGLLIVIILGMLGGVGYYVYNSQKQVDKTYSQTANSSVAPSTKKTTANAGANNSLVRATDAVIYQDDQGKLYQISLLASTNDQKQLAQAIDSYCNANDKAGMKTVGTNCKQQCSTQHKKADSKNCNFIPCK
jgi:Tfp pilus assembly protein PilE